MKIVVNIKKEEERMRKKSVVDNKSKVESTLDESGIKKIEEKPKMKEIPLAEISEIQTESIPLEKVKKQFCLYCFSRS